MDNLKIISTVLLTFIFAFATSLLLEIPLFKNPVRYILVVFLILVEIYFGFLLFKYQSKKSNKN